MEKPTATVQTTTATTAIMSIGPISSSKRLTLVASEVSNSRTGRKTNKKVSDETSKCWSESRKSDIRAGAQLCT
ncbi:hypothetical protein ECAE60S_03266 [Eoetvoesiella caeni]